MIIGIANNILGKSGRGSGAEVVAEKMIADLKSQGHQVFAITTKTKEEKITDETKSGDYYYLNSDYKKLANWSPMRKFLWHVREALLMPRQRQIKNILKKRKPELFITHNLIGLSYGLPKLLKKYNIKHEHVLHDIQLLHPSGLMYWGQENIINSWPARIYQYFTKNYFKKAELIISPSRWLIDLHLNQGFFKNQKTTIKPNFDLRKKIPPPLHTPLQFVFIGQIEKHKGISLLLQAWKYAALIPEQAQLILAGGGTLSAWLEQEIKKFNNVSYLGYLKRQEIDQLLEKSDVVIVPSLVYENSPTSLWEAAAKGRRAIASNLGGVPELSPYLDLQLVPPDNAEALAASLKMMIKNNN